MPPLLGRLGAGALGAAGGLAAGGPIGAGLAGLAGLLGGGKPKLSKEQREMQRMQAGIARQLYGFAGTAPGTSPDELAALAQSRGVLGQQQRATLQGLYGGMNLPGQGPGYLSDFLKNVSAQQTGQQMMLDEQQMMDALARRREALLQAAQVGRGAFEMAPPGTPASQLPDVLSQLAQALAYRRATREQQREQPVPTATSRSLPEDIQSLTQLRSPALTPTIGWTPGAPAWQWQGRQPLVPSRQPPPGDDPLMTALLKLLAEHGYHLVKGPQKKVGDPAMDPQEQAMMAMFGGAGGAPGAGSMMGAAPGAQGQMAPGNEPGGINTIANQVRQGGGYGLRIVRGRDGEIYAY